VAGPSTIPPPQFRPRTARRLGALAADFPKPDGYILSRSRPRKVAAGDRPFRGAPASQRPRSGEILPAGQQTSPSPTDMRAIPSWELRPLAPPLIGCSRPSARKRMRSHETAALAHAILAPLPPIPRGGRPSTRSNFRDAAVPARPRGDVSRRPDASAPLSSAQTRCRNVLCRRNRRSARRHRPWWSPGRRLYPPFSSPPDRRGPSDGLARPMTEFRKCRWRRSVNAA